MKTLDNLTVKEALQKGYHTHHIDDDGGIASSFVPVEFTPGLFLYIPNFQARKKVLLRHDIHHVLTEYPGVMKGETEISAWEISTGCYHNWVALILNYYGLLLGVILNLPGAWNAYLRGKGSRNLYRSPNPMTNCSK